MGIKFNIVCVEYIDARDFTERDWKDNPDNVSVEWFLAKYQERGCNTAYKLVDKEPALRRVEYSIREPEAYEYEQFFIEEVPLSSLDAETIQHLANDFALYC